MSDPVPIDRNSRVVRESHLRWVCLGEMGVSPAAQREFKQSHAEEYAADFDLEGFGYPVVNRRNGRWYIIDGQHRIAALRMTGFGPEQQIQCEAYEGLSEAEEAEMFLTRNHRRNVIAFATFRVAVTAGRSLECDIDRIVRAAGLKISTDDSEGSIGAVTALRKVYRLDGAKTLARTLRIIRDAYGGNRAAFRGELIVGIGLLCQRYEGTIDDQILIERLAKLPGGALGLIGSARTTKRQTGKSLTHCVASVAVDAYNAGRNGKKVECWWR